MNRTQVQTQTPWYADGLAFSCQGCGHCCRGPGGYVWVGVDEIDNLARAIHLSQEDFAKRYVRQVGHRYALLDNAQGDCILLDENGRCKTYADRPVQCRTYPWWPEHLVNRRAWEQEQRHCPGIEQGTLHPFETIEAAKVRASQAEEAQRRDVSTAAKR